MSPETRPHSSASSNEKLTCTCSLWHPAQDAEIADHRRPDQWKFFVVAEENLPQKKQTIGLEALTRLYDVCNYDALAARVVKGLESIESSFKTCRGVEWSSGGNDERSRALWLVPVPRDPAWQRRGLSSVSAGRRPRLGATRRALADRRSRQGLVRRVPIRDRC